MAGLGKVYVFSGKFASRIEACLYSQPQWEPEPDESVSDEEYEEWEDRNPVTRLKENIDSYLDEDFIETIESSDSLSRHKYLSSMLKEASSLGTIEAAEPDGANIFVLIYEDALGGFDLKKEPTSTKELSYCGVFDCK